MFQKRAKKYKKKGDSWLTRLAEIRQTLPIHDQEKDQDEGRIWECELCRNSFNRKDHLAKHIAFVHERQVHILCKSVLNYFLPIFVRIQISLPRVLLFIGSVLTNVKYVGIDFLKNTTLLNMCNQNTSMMRIGRNRQRVR